MGKYNLSQIGRIVVKRPNKDRIVAAQKLNKKLMLHVHGIGMKNALARMEYFENNDIYKARKEYAISNVDLFGRLLQEEEQVFTTKGGSSYFNLPDEQEKQMNNILSDVVYGMSLRKWVANFGINAYRCDPMGIIFIEVEKVTDITGADDAEIGAQQVINTPKAYPVYKSIQTVWDYQSNGQKLDYICFALTANELEMYGIEEKSESVYPQSENTSNKLPIQKQYFRFVDDGQDVIVRRVKSDNGTTSTDTVEIVTLTGYKNPITGLWNKVPAFIVSDLIKFSDPGTFDTPLCKVIELADVFLSDRSVKDLQKKYHGFAKAVEPRVTCVTCDGEGYVKGVACPECTIPGQTKGTGIKLQTKISDSLKVPMDMLNADKAPHFDFKKIYGYVTPDIQSVEMQINGLTHLEELMNITYWTQNKNIMQGFNGLQAQDETATKTLTDLQGKYARLNRTADWAEQTERNIANLIGEFWFDAAWKGAIIQYGRNYILEDPDTILATYYDMRKNGVPDSMLDNQYEKYIKCLWASNPVQASVYQNKFDVEPFPHLSGTEVEASPVILDIDKICKRYFGEWDDTIPDAKWATTDAKIMKAELVKYATEKQAELTKQINAEMEREAAMTKQPTQTT